jgi:hypothetical protein
MSWVVRFYYGVLWFTDEVQAAQHGYNLFERCGHVALLPMIVFFSIRWRFLVRQDRMRRVGWR